MKQASHSDTVADDELRDESLMQRFSRRKSEARLVETGDIEQQPEEIAEAEEALPTDEDMPPIESLTADSDFSPFMSPKVSEGLRKLALRKLFHSPEFNFISELDEYAEDFTKFELLGDIVTSDMRHQLEMEAKRRLEEAMNSDEAEELEEVPDITVVDESVTDEGDAEMDDLDVESET
ncbi:hypothetical protein BOW35_04015 [Solemya velum gill symbiont]|uniref:DUF3306 domain-containing protein n=1 Tax=Solemya velum gill symbiont TaxID=2340 RepID=UPI000997EC63|nr:DUF3306 domain-containing protein [Solemya velum gill symbiont]OOZ15613.1 hypothetical protein BOW27_03010 [Solemya velum gill symbiont]OOZ20426.1 hypothetical protein BOW29_02065 [Solemya velum gill symbiont]OOZ22299.1 hypothetical protein BOW30_06170 [Solemya velum gill symbiont]OOZ24576.1 hypothetical protein BOW31_05735 [Solemya velum gill symbiont]OOZ30070.1 hypothetical protein BOW33_02665 [Solemya velum gill symbiont]